MWGDTRMSKNQQQPEYDRRYVPASPRFELRAETTDEGTTLFGAAPPYMEWSEPITVRSRTGRVRKFIEMFEMGAFRENPDIISTHEHDDSLLLGRTGSGTVTIRDEKDARHYAVKLPDTGAGRDVRVLQERGDLAGSSFEFRTQEGQDVWFRNAGDMSKWLISKRGMDSSKADTIAGDSELERRFIPKDSTRMRQIGPVARPSYQQTGLAMRSLEAWEESQKPEPTPRADALRREMEMAGVAD